MSTRTKAGKRPRGYCADPGRASRERGGSAAEGGPSGTKRLHRSKRWSVRLIRGKRAEPLGRTGKSAEDEAITKFKLNEQQRKRLLLDDRT